MTEMYPLFNCTGAVAKESFAALVISSLVYTSKEPLPCPPASVKTNNLLKFLNISNCTRCSTNYEIAQVVAEMYSPQSIPPKLSNNISDGLTYADIVLILIVTAISGLVIFSLFGTNLLKKINKK